MKIIRIKKEKPKASGDLPSAPPENVNISPKAWEVALELEVDVTTITPSGRRGRISVQDVEQVADPAKLAAYKGEEEGDKDDRGSDEKGESSDDEDEKSGES